jgi:hypothetical protein
MQMQLVPGGGVRFRVAARIDLAFNTTASKRVPPSEAMEQWRLEIAACMVMSQRRGDPSPNE